MPAKAAEGLPSGWKIARRNATLQLFDLVAGPTSS